MPLPCHACSPGDQHRRSGRVAQHPDVGSFIAKEVDEELTLRPALKKSDVRIKTFRSFYWLTDLTKRKTIAAMKAGARMFSLRRPCPAWFWSPKENLPDWKIDVVAVVLRVTSKGCREALSAAARQLARCHCLAWVKACTSTPTTLYLELFQYEDVDEMMRSPDGHRRQQRPGTR